MKIMSFNTQHCLNYLEQKIDFEIMAKAILDCNADIVGLNEMRGSGSDPEFTDQVKILAELTKMPYYIFAPAIQVGNKGPYGNGFLSKIPIVKAETIMIPDPERTKVGGRYETRCVLRVETSAFCAAERMPSVRQMRSPKPYRMDWLPAICPVP